MKRARTDREMEFAVSLDPCPKCGTLELGELELHGGGRSWALVGNCPKCDAPRSRSFPTVEDPLDTQYGTFDLGPGASEIIEPIQFARELVRLRPLIVEDPTTLGPAAWSASLGLNDRALIAANELAKLVPEGAGADSANVEILQRTWIDDTLAHHQRLLERYVADKDRVRVEREREEAGKPKPLPLRTLTTDELLAHQSWLRTRTEGRLELSDVRLGNQPIGAAELTGAKLRGVDLEGGQLAYVTLDDAELVDSQLVGATLDSGQLQRATITGSTFTRAKLAIARFDGATIERCDFTKADLERADFREARITDANFTGARFGNAVFDRAVITRCIFARASFAKLQPRPFPTSTDTRFEDCDLTGVDFSGRDLSSTTFVRCQLAGAHGRPSAHAGLVLERCDVGSADALIKQLG